VWKKKFDISAKIFNGFSQEHELLTGFEHTVKKFSDFASEVLFFISLDENKNNLTKTFFERQQ
jgi:hypothetical protein